MGDLFLLALPSIRAVMRLYAAANSSQPPLEITADCRRTTAELMSTLSHLSAALWAAANGRTDAKKKNLEQLKGHLFRYSLDCHKAFIGAFIEHKMLPAQARRALRNGKDWVLTEIASVRSLECLDIGLRQNERLAHYWKLSDRLARAADVQFSDVVRGYLMDPVTQQAVERLAAIAPNPEPNGHS
jgi:hypothetical protein